jgi:hypothetical protein
MAPGTGIKCQPMGSTVLYPVVKRTMSFKGLRLLCESIITVAGQQYILKAGFYLAMHCP